MDKVTIKQIADAMGASEQFVRQGLQQQVFPWGYAVKKNQKFTYWINSKQFEALTGIKLEN